MFIVSVDPALFVVSRGSEDSRLLTHLLRKQEEAPDMPPALHPPAILATKYGKKPLFNRFGSPAAPADGY